MHSDRLSDDGMRPGRSLRVTRLGGRPPLGPGDRPGMRAADLPLPELVRRILVYGDMVRTEVAVIAGRLVRTGRAVRPDLLEVWPYQPSDDEVAVEAAILRPRARFAAFAAPGADAEGAHDATDD